MDRMDERMIKFDLRYAISENNGQPFAKSFTSSSSQRYHLHHHQIHQWYRPRNRQTPGSGRARRDAAARAMQGWHAQRHYAYGEVGEPIIKDKNLNKREKISKALVHSNTRDREKWGIRIL